MKPFAAAHLGLVMHFGDERTYGVDDEPIVVPSGADDLGRRAVRGQHERRARGHVVDVVHEHDAELAEAVDDEPVVHDLVVAVHGRLEHPHHPCERLDRHLHAGAKAARFGEQYFANRHRLRG